jgi:hypothetical protein
MGVIMRVEYFAIRTKVLSAEGTTVPFSNNGLYVPVAIGECMHKVAQVS